VPAQITDPNKDEQKCESSTGGALSKFVGSKSKCISKCIVTARKAGSGFAACFFPYSDLTEVACISDSLKGAETKASAAIGKACLKDCPECYNGVNHPSCAGTNNPIVTTTEGDIDQPFGPGTGFPDLIYCKEKGGTAPSKDEAKCEDGVSKALVKFVGAKNKCYAKCIAAAYKSGAGRGICLPPNAVDPALNTCINDPAKGAEAKAKAAIVKACVVLPGCYTGTAAQVANTFVSTVEGKIDQRAPQISCGSPSGAFVN